MHFLSKIAKLQSVSKNVSSQTLIYQAYENSITIFGGGCEKQLNGCWYNRYSQEQVYMGLEGGKISITAHRKIVYTSTQVRSIDGEPENNLWHSSSFIYGIDTSIYPYTIDTEWCIIEHTAPRQMDITILPSEQKRELFIRLGGIDENGITHRTPDDAIWIYQGYPAPASVPDR